MVILRYFKIKHMDLSIFKQCRMDVGPRMDLKNMFSFSGVVNVAQIVGRLSNQARSCFGLVMGSRFEWNMSEKMSEKIVGDYINLI